MNTWLGSVPTTNLRLVVTTALILVTGIVTLVRWTTPPIEWLGFLAISAGLDVTQFHLKRVTTFAPGKSEEEST